MAPDTQAQYETPSWLSFWGVILAISLEGEWASCSVGVVLNMKNVIFSNRQGRQSNARAEHVRMNVSRTATQRLGCHLPKHEKGADDVRHKILRARITQLLRQKSTHPELNHTGKVSHFDIRKQTKKGTARRSSRIKFSLDIKYLARICWKPSWGW